MADHQIPIKHIAELVRISLTEAEIETFGQQLGQIVDYFDILKTIDTTGVEPTTHAIPLNTVLRTDEIESSISPQEVLKNAPEQFDRYFRVPRVINER